MKIRLKIDVTKIKKEWLFNGKSGVYLDATLYENDEPDKFGNDCSIKQDPSKEARQRGEKGHFIGNGKFPGDDDGEGKAWPPRSQRQEPPPRRPSPPPPRQDRGPASSQEPDIPF